MLVIGAGGLGSPAALYLAAAGVGTLGIAEFDTIELSNLQRQILHSTSDLGSSKLESARRRLSQLNPEITIVPHENRLSPENIAQIISSYDVILDTTDNFATRYLVNDACVLEKKPNVYGAIYRFEGQASLFFPPQGPCYRCLFPDPPAPNAVPNCGEGGVLGVLAGLIGVIQATEALKLALGVGKSLIGRLLIYDAMEMSFDTLKVRRNSHCQICGDAPTITSLIEIPQACRTDMHTRETIEPVQLDALLKTAQHPFLLLDVREPEEHAQFHLESSTLIPLRELRARLQELDQRAEIVVYCRSGRRSQAAIELLCANGFANVKSLNGGLLAWRRDVDPAAGL